MCLLPADQELAVAAPVFRHCNNALGETLQHTDRSQLLVLWQSCRDVCNAAAQLSGELGMYMYNMFDPYEPVIAAGQLACLLLVGLLPSAVLCCPSG
jgi:hypothetical protein